MALLFWFFFFFYILGSLDCFDIITGACLHVRIIVKGKKWTCQPLSVRVRMNKYTESLMSFVPFRLKLTFLLSSGLLTLMGVARFSWNNRCSKQYKQVIIGGFYDIVKYILVTSCNDGLIISWVTQLPWNNIFLFGIFLWENIVINQTYYETVE